MSGNELKKARLEKRWTQGDAAKRLQVTQPYLSMLEGGKRSMTETVARAAVENLGLPVTLLPLQPEVTRMGEEALAEALATLGYKGFAHLQKNRLTNPAHVLASALVHHHLDSRLVEGLPWLAFHYPNMDWEWLTKQTKLQDCQNRLGFVVSVARDLARMKGDQAKEHHLASVEQQLRGSKLAKEDSLCHEKMTQVEKGWLREHRSVHAREWNLLTDLVPEQLPHAN